ncbi:hypothetical protein [Nocardia rhamnosiphila]
MTLLVEPAIEFLSPPAAERNTARAIPHFATTTGKVHAASDHAARYAEIDIA